MRSVPEALRTRYLTEGLWTDESLGHFLHEEIRRNAAFELRIWSAARPARTTLGAVKDRALALAGGLRVRGIGPGDVVAFQLPNWEEAAATFYGVAALGAVLVPIVHFYGPKEVGYILKETSARALVTADRFGRLDYLAALDSIRPELSALETVAVVAGESGVSLPGDVVSFDVLAGGAALEGPLPVDPDAPAVIGYTSGTTAAPKGVIHSHRTLVAEVRQLAAMSAPSERPFLTGAPVAHAIGMLAGLLLPLVRSEPIHLIDVWNPAAVLDAMLEADLSAGNGATFFLTSLLDAPGFNDEHLKRMPRIGLGGSPVPVAVADRAEALGIAVSRSYGSTEHPSTTGSPSGTPREKRNRTDGAPLPGVELRLVDDRGHEVEAGPGEICSRGPDLFVGYTDRSLTDEAVDADGWYATGDVGVLDGDGFLTITDRKKDVIIRGGENVSPAEVEELLACLPGVAEVAVTAAPDERLGEHGCAWLRLQADAAAPDLAGLRVHLEAAGLARQKWPEELRVVTDFPRTPSGKIQKFELRRRLREESTS